MKVIVTAILVLVYSCGFGQTTTDSIKQTINHFFTGMKNSDTVLLRSTLTDGALLQTISFDKSSGKMVVKNELIQKFIDQVSQMPKGAADERIIYDMIKVDANLASVWTFYNFYYNGIFSHCGVNSFTLVRLNDKWQIQYIIDTRRKVGCTE